MTVLAPLEDRLRARIDVLTDERDEAISLWRAERKRASRYARLAAIWKAKARSRHGDFVVPPKNARRVEIGKLACRGMTRGHDGRFQRKTVV